MARAIGAKAQLRTKPEVTYGTAPSGNWTQLNFKTFDLSASQGLIDDPVLGNLARRTSGDPALDTVDVTGSAVVPVQLAGIGHWLRLLLGAPLTTGAGPDYTHTFKDGAFTLPSNSFEVDFVDPTPNEFSVITGVKANEMSLDFSPSGPADATFSLLGQGETLAATTAAGTPVVVSGDRFQKPQASIKRNTVALANITAASFTFTNGMEAVKTIRSDLKVEGVDEGLSKATGQITARFADSSLISDAIANTAVALEFGYTISAAKSLIITFPRVFLSAPKKPISGPNGVELAIDFQAADDATLACLMQVVLKNQIASYA